VDLCKLAGLVPAGTICELVKPHDEAGGMARREDISILGSVHVD
jgi:3,4-dihydroxy-2-butanone 4-phosphate synthase